jgi:hypothetical protein
VVDPVVWISLVVPDATPTHIVDTARDDEQEVESCVLGLAVPLILVTQFLIYPGIDQDGFESGEPCTAGVSALGLAARCES